MPFGVGGRNPLLIPVVKTGEGDGPAYLPSYPLLKTVAAWIRDASRAVTIDVPATDDGGAGVYPEGALTRLLRKVTKTE